LRWGLGSTKHSAGDGGVNVWLVAGAGIIGLEMLLLARSTLRAIALKVVLRS
jgi:hypothetical protein